jgi:hypothetical protein
MADGPTTTMTAINIGHFFFDAGRHPSTLIRLSTPLTPGALQAARSACLRAIVGRAVPRNSRLDSRQVSELFLIFCRIKFCRIKIPKK